MSKEKDFSILFDKHYKKLYSYAYSRLKGKNISDEMVQESFIKLWQNFDSIDKNDRSIESFLIITLKNKIIDNYRKNQAREKNINLYTQNTITEVDINTEWELQNKIVTIYKILPNKTSEIFQLSRDKGLTYKEIALQKNISIKTVESHISKALRAFRKELKNYF